MDRVRQRLSLVFSLALLVSVALPSVAAVNDPLPAGGTVTEIDALIETNLVVLGGDAAPIQLVTHSKAHAQCETQLPVDSSGTWEFTNSFDFLQGTFTGTSVGTVVIVKNPNLPIIGVHETTSSAAVFPVHSKIRLFLQVTAMGLTMVNSNPIVIEADIDEWPEIGSVYQATTGNIDFFLTDSSGKPTGSAVAQLYGTRVTIEESKPIGPSEEGQEAGPG